MPIFASGNRELGPLERAWLSLASFLRRSLLTHAVVQDRQYTTRYVCETRLTAYRAVSLWLKEPGTMAWLDQALKPGDRFLDIGANIGIYALAAAHRVGAGGRVYAVEPHKPNAISLMRNILANGFQDRVDVLALPLSDSRTVASFNYTSLDAAVTGSQFGNLFKDGHSKEFRPAAVELCLGLSVDELVAMKAIEPPALVKIDVDGIELSILKGMAALLRSAARPRSIQVELNVGEHDAIEGFMAQHGYRLESRNFTLNGEKQRAAGKPLQSIAHNAVFVPVS
jgi:FkbM family methyltransferase